MAVSTILVSIILFVVFVTSTVALYKTFIIDGTKQLIEVQKDYTNAYIGVLTDSGKICRPGELGFATYVVWDNQTKHFVKKCVNPEPLAVKPLETNNVVVVVPAR